MARHPKDEADIEIDLDDVSMLCKDLESSCLAVINHTQCWIAYPSLGLCPFLRCETIEFDER